MKRLTWLFLSLMLFLGMGAAFAQGPDMPAAAGDLSQPTFTPAPQGAEIGRGADITVTLPADLDLNEYQSGMPYVLYYFTDDGEDMPTLAATAAELQQWMMYAYQPQGDKPSTSYLAGVYDGDGAMLEVTVPEDAALGVNYFYYRLAALYEDNDGDVTVKYSTIGTGGYDIQEGGPVGPVVPVFSLEEGEVDAGAELVLTRRGQGPIYYVIDGDEADLTETGYNNYKCFQFNEDAPIKIYKGQTVKAVAGIPGDPMTYSEVITQTYTVKGGDQPDKMPSLTLAPAAVSVAQGYSAVFSCTMDPQNYGANVGFVIRTKNGTDNIAKLEYRLDEEEWTAISEKEMNALRTSFLAAIPNNTDGNKPEICDHTKGAKTVYYRLTLTETATAPEVVFEVGYLNAYGYNNLLNADAPLLRAFLDITVQPAPPADEEDAPELTFTPDNTDVVDNNTEIMIDAVEGYTMDYGVFATVEDAQGAMFYEMEPYGEGGYPTVTAAAPVLRVDLTSENGEGQFSYYRFYTVKPASDVPMPTVTGEDLQETGLYGKDSEIKIEAEDETYTVWYTIDGSKPAINGATSVKGENGTATVTLSTSMVIKAIAVKDGKASDVKTARFTSIEDAVATLSLERGRMTPVDSIVGKNSPIMVNFTCAASPYLAYGFPYTVYYTTDGETEPSAEAYTGKGAIKKVETPMEYGSPAGVPSIVIGNESATTVRVKAYMEIDEDNVIVSETLVQTIDSIVYGLKAPEFTLPAGEVRILDTLRIKNPNPYDPETDAVEGRMSPPMIYFTLDGTLPINSDLAYTTNNSEFEDEIMIIFKQDEDEDGAMYTYAYIPSNEKYYDGSDRVRIEDDFLIQAICYDYVDYGEGMRGPGQLQYGSDFTAVTYTVMKDFPRPVIAPNGGEVAKGTEVTITAVDGVDIYYTTDGEEPEVGAENTKKYEAPIAVNEAMTLKAMAFKAKTGDEERDRVSNVAEATFMIQAALSFDPESGSEVEENAEVTIMADQNVDIFYMMFESEEAAKAAAWDQAKAESYSEELKPVLTPEKNTIKAAYAREDAEAVADVFFVATYKVKALPAIELTFNPASGSEVEEGAEITVTANRETEISYKLYADKAAADADEAFVTTALDLEEDGKPVITEGKTYLRCGVFEKGAMKYFNATYTIKEEKPVETVAKPEFSVKAGEVEKGTKVEITCATEGAVIYYTVDNSEPTAESTKYEAAIEITGKVTIKAIAIKGEAKSEVAEATYELLANEDLELLGVSVYPNPSSGLFNLDLPVASTVEVFAINGVLMQRMEATAGNTTLTINRSGIYFLRITGEGRTTVKRLIVK